MTATVFVIRNQAGLFLNKQSEWVDARQATSLYRAVHRDEAVNTVFEVSAKDIYLRAEVVACPVDARGAPLPDQASPAATAAPAAEPSQPAPADDDAEKSPLTCE